MAGLLGSLMVTNALAQGVPNVVRTPGELISGPNAPEAGRTAVIAFHGDMLITFPEAPGSPPGDYQVRAWDISDPANPQVTQVLGPTRHGFMAHGFMKTGERLTSGYTFEVDGAGVVSESSNALDFPWLGWGHSGMSRPWGVTDFWSYGDTGQPAEIHLDGRWNTEPAAVFDPVGATGVIGHAFVFGTTLYYASDQSRTGIAAWDVSDPSDPQLLDVLTDGSVGGYWPDPVGVNGRLYFFFPRNQPSGGYAVVDATDPTDLQLVADVPVEGNPNYAQFQDEYAFTERYKIDMRTFQVVLALDEAGDTRGGPPIDTSQWSLPVGNLVITGGLYRGGTCSVPGFGTHCGTGMSIWAHQAEPDTRGPFVGYHRPANGETNYPVTHSIQVLIHETLKSETINASTVVLRSLGPGGAVVPADYFFASNDILSIVPRNDLAANTTYEVAFIEDGIEDAVGNGMQAYSFTFSTGSSVSGGNRRPNITAFTVSNQPVAPGGTANFSTTANDPDSDPLEYRFDFGDGSATDWQTSRDASHSYPAEGHYTALVQVRDEAGAVASRSVGVTVVEPISGLRGVASAPQAMDGSGRLWVVNPDNDTITRFDAGSRSRIDELRTCADPRSVAIDQQERAWITCHDADQVLIIGANGRRQGLVELGYGAAPFGIAFNAADNRMLVSLYGSGEVALLSTTSLAEVDRLALGPTPRAVALTSDGNRALVTRFISPDDGGQVWDLSVAPNTLSLDRVIDLAVQWGIDDRADGRGVPNYLAAVAIAPDGAHAWVTGKKDNLTRGTYLSGINLDQDNTVRATLMKIDLATGEEVFDQRSDLDNSEQPSALAFSPYGDYLYVTLQGNNAVLVVDRLKIDAGFTGASSVVGRIGVGLAPQGVHYDDVRQDLWVQDFLDRTVTVIDTAGFEAGAGPAFPKQTLAKVGREALPATVLRGKQVFYNASDPRMSGEGYMSCASCHIDGGHDGRSYDFTDRGEGIRNTTSLRGRAGMGHGLVHWSANFDEIQDFEHDIRGAFGGTGFLSDAQFAQASTPLGPPKAGMSPDLDALAAYLGSLDRQTVPRSPQRQANGALTAAAVSGLQQFNAQGCAGCHGGVDATVSTSLTLNLQDMGTHGGDSGNRLGSALEGIDIPSLNGAWNTAPYLHNGAAGELTDVFDTTNGRTWQAEAGSATAEVRDSEHWSLGGIAVVREGAFLAFDPGEQVTLTVDGDGGGPATLRLRYHANYSDAALRVTVNGNDQAVDAPRTIRDWRYQAWETMDIPVSLNAGNNTVMIRYDSGGGFALDEVTVLDTGPALAAADPHSRVLNAGAMQRDSLIAYLRQLDARPAEARDVDITSPAAGATLADTVDIGGSASPGQLWMAVNNGPYRRIGNPNAGSWIYAWDTSALPDGVTVVTLRNRDPVTGTWVERQREFLLDQATGSGGDRIFRDAFEGPAAGQP
ncbi:MAG: Ig-like domain-containing protein [Xanthomonadales bacterium]|jgi:DNA-binding beta-propeller fold protein YncE|nr:Ig-like domain-containing protein [Xanthomonadales bacterium]